MSFGIQGEYDKGKREKSDKMKRRVLGGEATPQAGWLYLEMYQSVSFCKLFLIFTDPSLLLKKEALCVLSFSSPQVDLHDSSNNCPIKPRQTFVS